MDKAMALIMKSRACCLNIIDFEANTIIYKEWEDLKA